MQMKLLGSVASELGVNKWDAALLLQHYKYIVMPNCNCASLQTYTLKLNRWDVNKLHAHYWDAQKKVLKEVGIKRKKKKKKPQDKNAMVECLVCCDDVLGAFFDSFSKLSSLSWHFSFQVKASKAFTLACGHGPYCDTCWSDHLSVLVKNSSAEGILSATCMWPRCPIKYY